MATTKAQCVAQQRDSGGLSDPAYTLRDNNKMIPMRTFTAIHNGMDNDAT
jgi:hypothetical protein